MSHQCDHKDHQHILLHHRTREGKDSLLAALEDSDALFDLRNKLILLSLETDLQKRVQAFTDMGYQLFEAYDEYCAQTLSRWEDEDKDEQFEADILRELNEEADRAGIR